MPNLMLTSQCNYQCPYCFGMDIMGTENTIDYMTRETFLGLIKWLNKKPFEGNTVHLMGGEPTLHKDFIWIAEKIVENHFNAAVFSNMATSKAPEYAESLKELPIKWIVNVNPPETRTSTQEKKLRESLQILGHKVTLTFNMCPEPTEHDWILDLISAYLLSKKIKVGLVLPTLSHKNQYLEDAHYPIVAERVVEFARMCETFGVTLEYECGVPWCAFSESQMGLLWHLNSRFFSSCNSILDITPDGKVIYCLPLATLHAIPYHQFEAYPEAKAWFESTLQPYRPLGSTSECFSCNLLSSNRCRGGCMARVLKGVQNMKEGGVIEQQCV